MSRFIEERTEASSSTIDISCALHKTWVQSCGGHIPTLLIRYGSLQ